MRPCLLDNTAYQCCKLTPTRLLLWNHACLGRQRKGLLRSNRVTSAGVVVVRFLDIAKRLPAADADVSTGDQRRSTDARLQDGSTLEGLPCSLLPHGRSDPGLISASDSLPQVLVIKSFVCQ